MPLPLAPELFADAFFADFFVVVIPRKSTRRNLALSPR